MKKQTLYEILEVSENASEEIIEKAYKVLAKKYHPDLQGASEKQVAEEKMKKINEAYDVLGNADKRKEYDEQLRQEREAEKARYYQEQNFQAESVQKNYSASYTNNTSNENQQVYNYEEDKLKYQEKLREEEAEQRKIMQEKLNKEYENAYYNYLKSLGYKVKHKWKKENFIDLLIVLAIMAVLITALWFIPPSHDWMVNFYESNPIFKTIIDIIVSIVTGIFKGIWSFITGVFN